MGMICGLRGLRWRELAGMIDDRRAMAGVAMDGNGETVKFQILNFFSFWKKCSGSSLRDSPCLLIMMSQFTFGFTLMKWRVSLDCWDVDKSKDDMGLA